MKPIPVITREDLYQDPVTVPKRPNGPMRNSFETQRRKHQIGITGELYDWVKSQAVSEDESFEKIVRRLFNLNEKIDFRLMPNRRSIK